VLAHGFGLQRLAGARSLFLSGLSGTRPVEVDWISGALFMVRRSALRDVGGFDERFFMYAEDVDLGCRLRDAGWRLAHLPDISAVHVQGGPAAASDPSTRWLDSLAGLYARRNPGRFAAFRIGLGLGFGLRAAAYAAVSLVTGRRRGDARAMAVFARRVWLMPEPEGTLR
jgi:GT2 family glycosyltransferase